MNTLSRQDAKLAGLTTYFTGKPCKYGHITKRKTVTGACVACAVAGTTRSKKEGTKANISIEGGKNLPSTVYLRECFTYHNDGYLLWNIRPIYHFKTSRAQKVFNKRFAGKRAGYQSGVHGYITININNVYYKGHRLLYKVATGEEPSGVIDHIDGNTFNNKIENLRVTSHKNNSRNSTIKRKGNKTSVYKGVKQLPNGMWEGRIDPDQKYVKKTFQTEIEAAIWYDNKAIEFFGEFASINFPSGTAYETLE